MKIRVQLVVCDNDGHEETFTDVVVLEKACQRVEHLGSLNLSQFVVGVKVW
jgi:hypothetical protein